MSHRILADGIFAIAMVGLAGCATAPMHTTEINPAFRRTEVQYATREPRGTIIVDPANHYLYYVEGGGKAVRYGVAVGGEGFGWSGVAKIRSKQEWPDWYPTGDILTRHPELAERPMRLDVIFLAPGKWPRHLTNAFDATGI